MLELLTDLSPWVWITLGFLLGIVELLLPTTIFIWPALAAILVGVVLFLSNLLFWYQILLFLVLTVITTLLGRYFYPKFEKVFGRKNQSVLNNPSKRNIGKVGTVVSLEEDEGIGLFEGVRWHFRLREDTIPAKGSVKKVKVVDSDGYLLIVEPLPDQESH